MLKWLKSLLSDYLLITECPIYHFIGSSTAELFSRGKYAAVMSKYSVSVIILILLSCFATFFCSWVFSIRGNSTKSIKNFSLISQCVCEYLFFQTFDMQAKFAIDCWCIALLKLRLNISFINTALERVLLVFIDNLTQLLKRTF